VATIFYGGAFTSDDVELTALALQAFAIGLVGFSYVKILAPAYFAREDTRTPVRIGLVALAVNFLLSVTLAWYLTRIGFAGSHAGLALAISVAALLNAYLLYVGLRRDGVVRHGRGWSWLLLRVTGANAAMWFVLDQLERPGAWWLDVSIMDRIGWLAVTIVAGALGYFVVLLILGTRLRDFRLRRT
jgi:putative peptidoglycan lipid II flippase